MMNKILSAEGFMDAECTKCGAIIGTDQNMQDALGEPFNGSIISCTCGEEYDVQVGFKISPL